MWIDVKYMLIYFERRKIEIVWYTYKIRGHIPEIFIANIKGHDTLSTRYRHNTRITIVINSQSFLRENYLISRAWKNVSQFVFSHKGISVIFKRCSHFLCRASRTIITERCKCGTNFNFLRFLQWNITMEYYSLSLFFLETRKL